VIFYADTSVLLKTYVHENRSEEAIRLLEDQATLPPISPPLKLEFVNALHLKVFRNEITSKAKDRYLAAFKEDLSLGRYASPRIELDRIYSTAEQLAKSRSAKMVTRSMDILHVAIALEIGATLFISFDHRQQTLAKACGLKVLG
jgi:predicted nucleic acid-binding protein